MGWTYSYATPMGCYATLSGDTLRLGNSAIERVALWNDGNPITLWLIDKVSGQMLVTHGRNADFKINDQKPTEATFSVDTCLTDPLRPAYLIATVQCHYGPVEVMRQYRIFADVPAIAISTALRGRLNDASGSETSAADRSNIEHAADMAVKPVAMTLDRLDLKGNHWHGMAVEFTDITDWNNNLVHAREFISYRRTNHRGNILQVTDGTNGGGFIMLKEAPCSGVQLNYKGVDFISDFGSFMVTGPGVSNADITPGKWTWTYGSVICTFAGGDFDALTALRRYQKCTRVLNPTRDEMVMMNTWGDRSQDAKVNLQFCLEEIEKAAALGVSVFQIDDGWQYGKSPNSAMVTNGSFKNIYADSLYWTPDPAKYPTGLTPVVERGRLLGVEVGLWFNPSVENDFAHWADDARILTNLWRKYGIKVFKIDGLTITSKLGEERLRRMFDTVIAESAGEVSFNLDATASRRCGYHYFNEYGNIFLENRYTDWGNYYPYHTLRNLWQLSRWVQPEKLQIEFLNPWRNADKYAADDPFAPKHYSFDYLFAITMAAQPLAWMEASNLPDEAYSTARLIKDYRRVQHDFHRGVVLPIGQEPSGRSWTGFQSLTSPTEGYLLVYREANTQPRAWVQTWLAPGQTIALTPVAGQGSKAKAKTDADGRVSISLPKANSFVLYSYRIISK